MTRYHFYDYKVSPRKVLEINSKEFQLQYVPCFKFNQEVLLLQDRLLLFYLLFQETYLLFLYHDAEFYFSEDIVVPNTFQ